MAEDKRRSVGKENGDTKPDAVYRWMFVAMLVAITVPIVVLEPITPAPSKCKTLDPAEQWILVGGTVILFVIVLGWIVRLVFQKSLQQRAVLYAAAYLWVIIAVFAALHYRFGILHDGQVAQEMRDYLYFSAISFTTVGYGDFQPCPAGRVLAAFEGLLGITYTPIMIALLMKQTEYARASD